MSARWWETRWFLAAAMLLTAVPLLWPAVPPLTDLPGHIGRYRVMLGDEASLLDAYYSFEWRLVGNLGVDGIVAALGPLIGLEPAVKVTVIAIPMLTTGALLWLSRELNGRVSPWTLFALPLAYSYPFQFGFVNYCLAMALALGGWALWLRLGRLHKVRLRAAIFVPIGLAVWACHAMGWAMLSLFVFAGEWAQARGRGRSVLGAILDAALASLPLAPPALAMLAWRGGGVSAETGRFFDLIAKLKGLGSVLRDRWIWLDLPALLVIVLAVYAGIRGRAGRFAPEAAAAAALAVLAFLLLPFTLLGSAYADLRLLPFAFAVALAGMSPREGAPVRAIALAGLAFFLVRTLATTASFALYDADWRRELAALDHLPRGARVLALVGETCDQPWAHGRRTHLPAFATARRAAFANDQWRMEGAPLLTVKIAAGYFAHDPSQISVERACPHDPNLMQRDQALATFPRAAFTHVWLIDAPASPASLHGLSQVWKRDGSALYAVDGSPTRLPEHAAPQ